MPERDRHKVNDIASYFRHYPLYKYAFTKRVKLYVNCDEKEIQELKNNVQEMRPVGSKMDMLEVRGLDENNKSLSLGSVQEGGEEMRLASRLGSIKSLDDDGKSQELAATGQLNRSSDLLAADRDGAGKAASNETARNAAGNAGPDSKGSKNNLATQEDPIFSFGTAFKDQLLPL